MSIGALPIALILFCVPIYAIWKEVVDLGIYGWIYSWSIFWIFWTWLSFFIGFVLLKYVSSWIFADIRIILLLKELEKFNESWKDTKLKIQKIDEILSWIESIHKHLYALPVLKNYAYTKDSKYLFLQKTEIEFFHKILTDFRSDLQIRLVEQQKTLEQAKSEVQETIKGTIELEQVSELQQARLDRQIEQFEELQKILVKV